MTRELVPLLEVQRHRSWCTPRYARRLVAERRIAFHRVGRRVLLDLNDLDAYAEAGRVEPPTPRRLRAVDPRSPADRRANASRARGETAPSPEGETQSHDQDNRSRSARA
jgi:excisionase family DNA binding protein